MTAIQEETPMLKPMAEPESMLLPLELVLNAKVLPRREDKASLSTMETVRHGLMIAIQVETHMLRKMVELVLMLLLLQELVLNARDSLKEDQGALVKRVLTVWHNTMVILRLGLMIAIQIETHMPKPMEELESTPPLLELVLSARDSPKREDRASLNIMVTHKLGLMTATQEEILMLKPMVEPVSMPLLRELELNAKDLLREEDKASPNTMETPRLGLMTATQVETHMPKKMVELVLMLLLLQELVLNARDLPKREDIVLLNIMVTLKLGLTHAIQQEMSQLKRTQVEQELGRRDKKDHTQALVSNAKDSLREDQRALLSLTETEMPGLKTAIPPEMFQLKRTQVVQEPMRIQTKAPTQVLASNAKALPKPHTLTRTK